jgi:YfiH family protein
VTVPHQLHGSAVIRADQPGPGYRVGDAQGDGVATVEPGAGVAVHTADCLPIAIAGAGGVAMVHGGWRGLAAGVIDAAVSQLRALGIGGRLEAAIGPGAGGCCYEVGPELHEVFAAYGASHGTRLDLAAVASAQLERAGIVVAEVGICTLCAPPGLLFSHRRDGPDTGRQAGIAWLR